MICAEDVVAEARTWVGTRWHHQGALKGIGCDCIGLVAGVAHELGMPEADRWLADYRRLAYTRAPDPVMLTAAAQEYLAEIGFEELAPGDVALFRIGLRPQHFGIVTALAPRGLVHAYAPSRRVVENTFEGQWAAACCGAFRYRALC